MFSRWQKEKISFTATRQQPRSCGYRPTQLLTMWGRANLKVVITGFHRERLRFRVRSLNRRFGVVSVSVWSRESCSWNSGRPFAYSGMKTTWGLFLKDIVSYAKVRSVFIMVISCIYSRNFPKLTRRTCPRAWRFRPSHVTWWLREAALNRRRVLTKI